MNALLAAVNAERTRQVVLAAQGAQAWCVEEQDTPWSVLQDVQRALEGAAPGQGGWHAVNAARFAVATLAPAPPSVLSQLEAELEERWPLTARRPGLPGWARQGLRAAPTLGTVAALVSTVSAALCAAPHTWEQLEDPTMTSGHPGSPGRARDMAHFAHRWLRDASEADPAGATWLRALEFAGTWYRPGGVHFPAGPTPETARALEELRHALGVLHATAGVIREHGSTTHD